MPKDKNLEKYLRIVERLRNGRPVSKEELKHFASYSQDINEGKLAKIKDKLATILDIEFDEDFVFKLLDEIYINIYSQKYKQARESLEKLIMYLHEITNKETLDYFKSINYKFPDKYI